MASAYKTLGSLDKVVYYKKLACQRLPNIKVPNDLAYTESGLDNI